MIANMRIEVEAGELDVLYDGAHTDDLALIVEAADSRNLIYTMDESLETIADGM